MISTEKRSISSVKQEWRVLPERQFCCDRVTLLSQDEPGKMRMRSLIRAAFRICLTVLFVAGVQVISQGIPKSIHFTRTIWRVSDGLPEDTVQAITESPQGLLWLGTTGGLARFDGSHIQPFDLGHSGISNINSIFCLRADADGNLWAGTEGGGVLEIRGSEFKQYFSARGLTNGFVRAIYVDHQGKLWVGTDGGLFWKNGNTFVKWNDKRDANAIGEPLSVHSITEDRENRLWVGGSRLFAINRDGHEQQFKLPGIYSENRVKTILQTSDGTVWVGTVGGLQRLRNGHFETLRGIHSTVRTLLQTSDGTLWIGTIAEGLWTFKDNRLTHVSGPQLLPSDTVLSIFEDDQKQVWIGTQAGLVRFNSTPVNLIPLPEGSDSDFETISGDSTGNVWIAAQNLYLIHDGVAKKAAYGNLPDVRVRNIFRARDGELWIGTDGSGAYLVHKDGQTTHYSAPSELTNNFIRGFMEARDGSMWVATDEGVSVLSEHGVRKFTEANGLVYFSARSMLEDAKGGVWIGTDRGLSFWKNGIFQENAATRELKKEKVWSILEDRAGMLWLGTRDHGIFRYHDNVVEQYTTSQGLPTNSVYQILQDRHSGFWMTGPNVIASLNQEEMDGKYPESDQPLSSVVYDMPFGAEEAELYGGRQPEGFLAPDDSVWFPTNRGAAHVIKVAKKSEPRPRPFLENVVEDGQNVVFDKTLRVPSRVSRMSFEFSSFFLNPLDGLRFRYKLEHFDRDWIPSGSNRSASYTNLPAGKYRFRLIAFDTARPLDISEIDLDIVKAPIFYQTWWFYLLCGVGIAGAIWMGYQIHLGQLRRRFDAVLAERGRIARELHDTVIQGCTSISALLEAVAVTAEGNRDAREELLTYARRQARSTADEARQVVWDMRHEQEGDVDLVQALRGVSTQASRESGDTVDLKATIDRLDVKASAAHEILMSVREAVTNSIQHSGTKQVLLQLHIDGENIIISIEDHGCGFSPSEVDTIDEGHYGIVGMRERMERTGGSCEIRSIVGAGTCVQLVIASANVHKSISRS
jgi:ligand-binding sensor domain-containing protein/anti-sigma regulatory factor (Ser/Thr protein kinase)